MNKVNFQLNHHIKYVNVAIPVAVPGRVGVSIVPGELHPGPGGRAWRQ